MVKKQNLAGNLSCVYSPIPLQPCPSSSSLQGTLEETGAESILIVHFLPHFWFSVQVRMCVCNLPRSKYLEPDVSAPNPSPDPSYHCLSYANHPQFFVFLPYKFLFSFASWFKEGILIFGFMNSPELL